ncbi:MAG: hypothetical protein JXD19_11090 [Deltaproteobacteria bacterium]|nr:hypothetical protein [Deltaproteobacteria bacterium]
MKIYLAHFIFTDVGCEKDPFFFTTVSGDMVAAVAGRITLPESDMTKHNDGRTGKPKSYIPQKRLLRRPAHQNRGGLAAL